MIRKGATCDLYVLLADNAGRTVSRKHLASLKKTLLEKFGGFTHLPQKGEGEWKVSGHTFRDKIVIDLCCRLKSAVPPAIFRPMARNPSHFIS
jgi:hypothetical protein